MLNFTDNSVIYPVSELNQMVAMALSEGFPPVKVLGEVSNFSCPRSGHWYFSLKDDKAQVRCVFFQAKQRAGHINLTDGMQVIAQARLGLYKARGEFQLAVESLELIGDGVLQRQFDLLKARLAQEGLFDSERKKPLPTIIKTIGLITSPTGAAICDVLAVLNRRFPAIEVIVYPTLVQGVEAANQITHQIQVANQRAECQALILTRGGGSLEDLWSFNEEIVTRAIAASALPIISAVGHEIDMTIADFVADVRAPTPSAAAELISPDQVVWKYRLSQFEEILLRITKNRLETCQKQLLALKRCLRHPEQRLQNISQQLDEWERRLQYAAQQHWKVKHQQLINLARTLDNLNPLATLVRGYSLIKRDKDEVIVQDAHQVQPGDNVTAQLAQGKIMCRVEKVLLS